MDGKEQLKKMLFDAYSEYRGFNPEDRISNGEITEEEGIVKLTYTGSAGTMLRDTYKIVGNKLIPVMTEESHIDGEWTAICE